MRLRNDERRFGAVAQAFHWLTVLLVAAMFGLGWYMNDLPLGPEKFKLYNLHKSIGISILTLTLLRLAWRMVSPPPPLPAGMSRPERAAAAASHALLYLLLFAQPAIGIVQSWAANFPIVVFGQVTLPSLIRPDEALKTLLGTLHSVGSWAIFALLVLHVAAALRHHLVLKDDVLRRMLPGGGP